MYVRTSNLIIFFWNTLETIAVLHPNQEFNKFKYLTWIVRSNKFDRNTSWKKITLLFVPMFYTSHVACRIMSMCSLWQDHIWRVRWNSSRKLGRSIFSQLKKAPTKSAQVAHFLQPHLTQLKCLRSVSRGIPYSRPTFCQLCWSPIS